MLGTAIASGQIIPSLFDCIHSGIIAINREGTVIICNSAAQKLLGASEEIIGKPIASIVPETKLLDIINTGLSEYGKRFYYKDKTFVVNRTPILDNGTVVGAVVVFQDVTELEEISTELESFKKVNKELEGIIASSYDGIIITDGEGYVIKINQALLRVTDLSRDYFLGKKIDSLYEDGLFSFEPVAKRARVGKKIITGIQKINTGKEVMVTSTPVFDDDGQVIRVVTNVRDMSDLINLQEQLAHSRELSNQLRWEFNKLLEDELRSHELITRNPEMFRIVDLTRRVAGSGVTVLLQGESGVGKEVFAKLVHVWSKRKGAFMKVNCSALPAQLLESELFGYAKGAFTGANNEGKPGFCELADAGTLFLDEIEDLPLELQGKFLRVLQDGEFMRLGGTKVIKVNVRLIAASNKDLAQMVKEHKFRQDLYYRLNVVPINIPPLRARREDIPLLIEYFLKQFNEKYATAKTISPQLLQGLMDYEWPGNVRELKNILERLVLTSSHDVLNDGSFKGSPPRTAELADMAEIARGAAHKETVLERVDEPIPLLKEALEQREKEILMRAVQKYGNLRRIGQVLGISHTAVLRKLKKYQ